VDPEDAMFAPGAVNAGCTPNVILPTLRLEAMAPSRTSVRALRWLGLLLFVGVTLPAFAAPATAPKGVPAELPVQPPDARTLLRALASVDGLQARFVEKKKLALLRAPLRSEGRIYFMRPGHLARFVESPTASVVRIGPDALHVEDQSGTQQFDLRGRPDIKTFVESFVHVVAGNHEALASTYSIEFAPAEGEDPWLLTLTPKRKPLSELIERLEIRGHGYEVRTVRVLEGRGDTTEIALEAVDPQRRFSAEERRRLFGLGPARR
jgi:hypothetical protein